MKKLSMRPNPQNIRNFLSYITFWWMNEFFARGNKKQLQENDMYELHNADKSFELTDRLQRNWKKELEKSKTKKLYTPSLIKALLNTFGLRFLSCGIFALLEEVLRIIHPIVVGLLISYFQTHSVNLKYAYMYAGIISIISFFLAIIHHIYFYHVQRIGWHLRAGICALMYKKTLRLSQRALAKTTTGQIVNLGASDVMRFDFLPLFLHYLWIGPGQCLAVVIILWQDIGPPVLSGMAYLGLAMTTQSLIGRMFGKLRMKTAMATDTRVRLMSEIIAGMKIIKMYNWQKSFAQVVGKIRKIEVGYILKSSCLRAFNFTTFTSSGKMVAFATFVVYVHVGGELNTAKVFVAIGLFNVIRLSVGLFFPLAIEKTAESLISIKRIQTFLLLDEIQHENKTTLVLKSPEDASVTVDNLTAKWEDEDENSTSEPQLSDISVKISGGKLFAVIGPVGAGKSSFLSAILGEIGLLSGSVHIAGKIAYAPQVPWVFAGTFRDNVLFGETFDEEWYDQVIKVCALEKDIEMLPDGQMTMIGERGVTLSGGQKARISLARAVYRKDADIMLLDDPLSAVDAAVAKHLFEECICKFLSNKIRILVTHQLQFLKDADKIMVLKQGYIDVVGTFEELKAEGTDFAALLKTNDEEEDEGCKSPVLPKKDVEFILPRVKRQLSKHESKHSITSHRRTASQGSVSILDDIDDEAAEKLLGDEEYISATTEEDRAQGSVGGSVYMEYFRIGAHVLFLIVMVVMILVNHVAFIMADWWIGNWAHSYEQYKASIETTTLPSNASYNVTTQIATTIVPSAFNTRYYVIWYSAIVIILYVSMFIRSVMHFYLCVTSGIEMHKKMFKAILSAPIRLFDTNPVGRILNRFSKDMGQIDELLPITLMDFFYISGLILSIIVLACVINYISLVVVIPLVIVFFYCRQYYLKTSRDIKRMEGTTRSPVFSLLSSTLQGLTTIRAFQVENQFEEKFHEYQDLHSCSWFLFLCGGRWLGFRLDFLSGIFITTVGFTAVAASSLTNISASDVGLILTYAVTLLGMFQWGVRQSAEVENLMTSVERVQQYYKIPPEQTDKVCKKPPAGWPSHGGIVFESASFAHYAGGPAVLKNIKLNIRAQEKIGIVGRTGAGKSSLISALFRFQDLSDGDILIDGISISSLYLDDLRSVLAIIPQDPILFTGSMRYNLDPFDQYEDDELWNALEQVELKSVVEGFPLKLETEMVESGTNFSVGQRQLVCLARAILKHSKILIIDEATANVDIRTDRLIQIAIREKFKSCTVLTIAHRINTIIDSDRVLVLDAGKVVEFDNPYLLLRNVNGAFAQMVKSTGEAEAQNLKNMARSAFKDHSNHNHS